jgi:hypothetical protein
LPFVCLADPEKIAYRAFGLRQGTLGQVAGPRMWLGGLRAVVRGGIGTPQGDPWQMPGTFVVDRVGIIRFAHYGATSVDRPNNDELVRVLEGIRSRDDDRKLANN